MLYKGILYHTYKLKAFYPEDKYYSLKEPYRKAIFKNSKSSSMLCGDLNGKEMQKTGDVCIHIADSLCCYSRN